MARETETNMKSRSLKLLVVGCWGGGRAKTNDSGNRKITTKTRIMELEYKPIKDIS